MHKCFKTKHIGFEILILGGAGFKVKIQYIKSFTQIKSFK